MASSIDLVREVNGYEHTLSIDVFDYEGWKVRIRGYDGQSPMPSIFELLPGGKTAKATLPLYEETVAKYRKQGYAEELDAASAKRIEARRDKERKAEEARESDLRDRLAAFPVSAIDRNLAKAIAKPASVKELDLRANGKERLTVLPPDVKKLVALEVLRLDGNGLKELPEELGRLKALRELHAAENAIDDIPAAILRVKTLAVLDLTNNRIGDIYWKPRVPNARFLVGGNPLRKAIQGGFTFSAFGYLPSFHELSIDTQCFFPIDRDHLAVEYGGIERFPNTTITFTGRKPSAVERKSIAEYFPAKAEGKKEVVPAAQAKVPTRKPTGKMHAEQKAHLDEVLARAKKLKIPEAIVKKAARPSIELITAKPGKKMPRSRFGGDPDLPRDAKWPAGLRGPMQFVGQIDLADLALFDTLLPKKGLLSFFVGHYDEGIAVLSEDDALEPRKQPKDAKFSVFPAKPGTPCPLEIRGGVSLPCDVEAKVDRDAWHDLVTGHHRAKRGKEPPHRMLGHTLGDIESPEADHALIAIRSDPNTGMQWGDWGTIYFLFDDVARLDQLTVRSTD
jgi:hypothetical protein